MPGSRWTMKRRAFVAAVVALVLVATVVVLVAWRDRTRNELTVVNRSGVALQSLEVALPWEVLRFGPLDDGQARTQSFAIRHDADFRITGRLADGTKIRVSDGYVTNGQYGESVRIEIRPGGGVRFQQG